MTVANDRRSSASSSVVSRGLAGRYYVLDAMRGVGALAVVHFHAFGIGSGYYAVDFFFMLSGFVITLRYERPLASGNMGFYEFGRARLLRLYPLYFLGFVLGIANVIVFGALTSSQLAIDMVTNILVLPAPVSGNFFPLNEPSWSLFYEAIINVVFAVVLCRTPTRLLNVVAFVSAIALALAIYLNGSLGGWTFQTAHIGLLRVTFSFSLGVILARSAPRRFESMWSLVLIAVLLALLYVHHSQNLHAFISIIAIIAVCPIIIVLAVQTELPLRFQPFAAFLGDISYPLYIIHFPMLPIMMSALTQFNVSGPIKFLVITGFLIIISYCLAMVFSRIMKPHRVMA